MRSALVPLAQIAVRLAFGAVPGVDAEENADERLEESFTLHAMKILGMTFRAKHNECSL
jgi:hypothetical protein